MGMDSKEVRLIFETDPRKKVFYTFKTTLEPARMSLSIEFLKDVGTNLNPIIKSNSDVTLFKTIHKQKISLPLSLRLSCLYKLNYSLDAIYCIVFCTTLPSYIQRKFSHLKIPQSNTNSMETIF